MKKNVLYLILLILFNVFQLAAQSPLYQNVLVSDQGTGNGIGEANTSRNVAVDIIGNIYVVYSGSDGIRVSKSTNRGQSFLPSVQVSTDNLPAEITISSNGTLFVAWGNGGNIYLSKSNDSGSSFTTPQYVGSGSEPHVDTNGSKIYILPRDGSTLYYNNNNGDGGFITTNIGAGRVFSDVFVDSTDGAIYAIADDPNIYLSKSVDGGGTFLPVLLSQSISVYFSSYALSIGPNGKFIFIGGASPSDTQGYKIDISNGVVSAITLGSNIAQGGRCLMADEFGNFVDGYNDGSSLKINVSNNQGTTWQTPIDVINATSHNIAKNSIFNDAVVVYSISGQVYVNVYSNLLIGSLATHLNFDGTNDGVALTHSNFPLGNSQRTIEAWVKTSQNNSGGCILSYGNNTTNNRFGLYQTGGKLNFVGQFNDYFTNISINDDVWHHVAATFDGANLKIYLDGVQVGTTQSRTFNTAGSSFSIGYQTIQGEFLNGSIDEVRIWNTARTAEQINGSKNCELQGTETGLVAYYNFNQGIAAANNTGVSTLTATTGPNGTLNNFALTGSTSNWLAGSPVTTGSIVPSNATVTTPVVYNQGATASALTATTGTNGTGLLWYTSATGGTGSTTAPTPSTTTAGSTSYWVSSTNTNGCGSARVEIIVQVNAPATHLNFDGVNDYVNCGNILTNSYTKEAWVYVTNSSLQNNFISGGDLDGKHAIWAPNSYGNRLSAGHNDSWNQVQDPTPLNLNTWYHVAVTYDASSTTMKLYKNGILVSTNNSVAPFINGNALRLGAFNNANNQFGGNLDEVRVWDYARTIEQINGSKNCELQGVESGLIAYYNFNQGFDTANNSTVTSLPDLTSNAYNGTLNNFALTGSTSNWLAGSPVASGSIVPSNATVTTPVVYNQGATASALTATTGTNGTGLLWYTTATGGTGSTTAPTPSTATAGSTSYWVSSTNANGCESARAEIIVNIIPSAPTASAQTFCNTATVADLVATGSGLQWYSASTGGSALATTTSLSTATYYVSQTVNGIESARTAVSVTVNVTPAPTASSQTFCNTATVADLVATGSGLQWYASSTGGSALASTTSLSSNTYYVSQTISGCESATRTAVSVTVNVTPSPTASAQTFCNTATVADLVATGSGLQWYASSTGGSALASTTSLSTNTYYVSQTISGCESATRTAVSVTVNVTPSPTASSQTFCNTATVADLVATGSGLQWYASSTGGSALVSTTSLTTATYYVSQTVNGCESATRTAVSVTVNVTPAPTASAQTFCNTATVADLVATGSGLQWYASSTGGSALASTTSLTTATYYVSQTISGCESATRTAVSVTVNVTPAPTASVQTFCNTATVADLVATGSGLQWYASSTGGSALASTTSLTTATYYVSQTVNGCESATRTAVSVTIATIGLIRQHWNDVIFFDNSSNEYVSYQWFKNGVLVPGENNQFFKENGDLDGIYFAKAMTTSGVEVTSCSIEIVPNTEIRSIKVIPNPNASGQMTLVKMNLSSTELTGAKLYLFSITGELLNVIDVTSDEMQIQVPYTQGIFPLRLQLQNGDVLSVNIAVK